MLNTSAIKAVLNNTYSRLRLRDAIHNVGKLSYCVDHVYNSKGEIFLTIRVKAGKLIISDNKGQNVTRQFKQCLGV